MKKYKRSDTQDEIDDRFEQTQLFLYDIVGAQRHTPTYADAMGITPARLRSYWEKDRTKHFPAIHLKALFRASDFDPRIANYFLLEDSPYRLEKVEDALDPGDYNRALVILGMLQGRINELFLKAMAPDSEDGEAISTKESKELAEALDELIHQSKSLRATLG